MSLDTLKGGQRGQGGGGGQQGGVGGGQQGGGGGGQQGGVGGGGAGDVVEVVVLLTNFNFIVAKHLLTKAVGVAFPRPTCSV